MINGKLINRLIASDNLSESEVNLLYNNAIRWITEELAAGRSVRIRGFGSFELKVFPGNTTVFFTTDSALNPDLADESENSGFPFFFKTFRDLLSQGEVIDIEELGTFRQASNSGRISYIPSPKLRNSLVNAVMGGSNTKSEEVRENYTDPKEIRKIETEDKTKEKEEKREKEQLKPVNFPSITNFGFWNEKNKHPLAIGLIVCLAAAGIIMFGLFNKTLRNSSPKEDLSSLRFETSPSSENMLSLVDLAKEHYGDPAFWVYIYDANQDKHISPFAVSVEVELYYPDLLIEYNVHIEDTTEVLRANAMAEMILKQL